MSDQYDSFSTLAASEEEGQDYGRELLDRDCGVLVMAPHGGGIEQGTSEIARAVAGGELSLYCFNGLKRTDNDVLHITSTRFDEPQGLDLLRRNRTVVAIHGSGGWEEAIYVGGRDEDLCTRFLQALNEAGFDARPAEGPRAGTHPDNACNRGATRQGVQLEISRGLRCALFAGLDRRGRRTRTPAFQRLATAIRQVLLEAQ